jgi:ADP-ribosylglycohydrolase
MGGFYENKTKPFTFSMDMPWQISDDTQLTLATCEAIIATGKIDPVKIADNFLYWYSRGLLTGLGSSTLGALKGLQAGGHWALVGRQGEFAAGNGAAMRIAPLAFLNPSRQTIADVCRITHRNDEAYIAALAVCECIRAIIDNKWPQNGQLIPQIIDSLPDTQVKDKLLLLNDETACISEVSLKYGNTGFAADSVPLAIYAAQQVLSLPLVEIFTQIVNSGGDTDTICSIAGQIAGAAIGFKAIPQSIQTRLSGIKEVELLKSITERFIGFVESRVGKGLLL